MRHIEKIAAAKKFLSLISNKPGGERRLTDLIKSHRESVGASDFSPDKELKFLQGLGMGGPATLPGGAVQQAGRNPLYQDSVRQLKDMLGVDQVSPLAQKHLKNTSNPGRAIEDFQPTTRNSLDYREMPYSGALNPTGARFNKMRGRSEDALFSKKYFMEGDYPSLSWFDKLKVKLGFRLLPVQGAPGDLPFSVISPQYMRQQKQIRGAGEHRQALRDQQQTAREVAEARRIAVAG